MMLLAALVGVLILVLCSLSTAYNLPYKLSEKSLWWGSRLREVLSTPALRQMCPYNENSAKKVQQDFVTNGIRRDDEELDLGPGLAAIERDELGKQGKLRSFPRSRKVKQESIQKLGVEPPPLVKSLELDGLQLKIHARGRLSGWELVRVIRVSTTITVELRQRRFRSFCSV